MDAYSSGLCINSRHRLEGLEKIVEVNPTSQITARVTVSTYGCIENSLILLSNLHVLIHRCTHKLTRIRNWNCGIGYEYIHTSLVCNEPPQDTYVIRIINDELCGHIFVAIRALPAMH